MTVGHENEISRETLDALMRAYHDDGEVGYLAVDGEPLEPEVVVRDAMRFAAECMLDGASLLAIAESTPGMPVDPPTGAPDPTRDDEHETAERERVSVALSTIERTVRELAMLVRQEVAAKDADRNDEARAGWRERARDYLTRKQLWGSLLRLRVPSADPGASEYEPDDEPIERAVARAQRAIVLDIRDRLRFLFGRGNPDTRWDLKNLSRAERDLVIAGLDELTIFIDAEVAGIDSRAALLASNGTDVEPPTKSDRLSAGDIVRVWRGGAVLLDHWEVIVVEFVGSDRGLAPARDQWQRVSIREVTGDAVSARVHVLDAPSTRKADPRGDMMIVAPGETARSHCFVQRVEP